MTAPVQASERETETERERETERETERENTGVCMQGAVKQCGERPIQTQAQRAGGLCLAVHALTNSRQPAKHTCSTTPVR
jgi:hypothetical protein